ncbi:MAG: protein-S-isoprenylcysteine methyltransferase, partial [Alphaproteobacteria bacterium]|nr:protein-S-isoprenylcysteine methyltransferase [Alphaproteobacteria bacterium]
THRGIITHGPYAVTKHPAYVAKVLFWWLSVLPFCVTTGKPSDMIRNCAAMAGISGIYYWRAKTEEAHLSDDPIYRAYASWIAHHGLFARIKNWGRRWAAPKNTRA